VIFEVVLTSIDRTAYPRFARMVSARELADAFTPAGDEVVWAREKTTTGQHLLALVVRLKCYQRLGYSPQLDEVPDSVVGHIRGLLGLSGEVAAQVEANRAGKAAVRVLRRDGRDRAREHPIAQPNQAAFSPLSPLAVPLLLKPLGARRLTGRRGTRKVRRSGTAAASTT
jgi:Domain of unknown function (DUF4158)